MPRIWIISLIAVLTLLNKPFYLALWSRFLFMKCYFYWNEIFRNASIVGQCLLNIPESGLQDLYTDVMSQLPGQIYNIDEQCKLKYGSFSHYCYVS